MHPGFQINEVYLHRAPIDFRKSICSLSAVVEQGLGRTPFDGSLYAFINHVNSRANKATRVQQLTANFDPLRNFASI